jgi:phosphate transport system substrate-binding protein
MIPKHPVMILLPLALLLVGCPSRQEVSTTTGVAHIECDEALFPVIQLEVEDFKRSYREADIQVRPVGAREAIVNFINDSIRIIATARPLNIEELAIIKSEGIEYRAYKIALDGVAIIMHRENQASRLRTTQLDSILSGTLTQWPVSTRRGKAIEIALSGVNSSTNEIVRSRILNNKPFTPSARYFEHSGELLDFVRTQRNAIGIIGLSWLRGVDHEFTVASLADPAAIPDSTQPAGQYYSPVQANIYRRYYPLSTEVYFYNREILRTVGLGFIAYVGSLPGQKVIQESGLVPATMPVRLIETSSKQVKPQ